MKLNLNVLFNYIWLQVFTFIFFIFFLLSGTYLFILMEKSSWWNARDGNWKWRKETMDELWQILKSTNVTRKIWRLQFFDKISGTDSDESNFCSPCVWSEEELCVNPWTFDKTISYCTGLCLTLGYGGMAPVSQIGIITTTVFAVMGMAQMVYILGTFGALLASCLNLMWTAIVRFYYTGIYYKSEITVKRIKNPLVFQVRKVKWLIRVMTISAGNAPGPWSKEINQTVDAPIIRAEEDNFSVNFPLWMALVILGLYIVIGEILIRKETSFHGWGNVESTYYHINLFTTIGFIDLPLQDEIGVLYSHMYLFGGFLLLSLIYDLVQAVVSKAKPVFLKV